jgi:hypothetical protein
MEVSYSIYEIFISILNRSKAADGLIGQVHFLYL